MNVRFPRPISVLRFVDPVLRVSVLRVFLWMSVFRVVFVDVRFPVVPVSFSGGGCPFSGVRFPVSCGCPFSGVRVPVHFPHIFAEVPRNGIAAERPAANCRLAGYLLLAAQLRLRVLMQNSVRPIYFCCFFMQSFPVSAKCAG